MSSGPRCCTLSWLPLRRALSMPAARADESREGGGDGGTVRAFPPDESGGETLNRSFRKRWKREADSEGSLEGAEFEAAGALAADAGWTMYMSLSLEAEGCGGDDWWEWEMRLRLRARRKVREARTRTAGRGREWRKAQRYSEAATKQLEATLAAVRDRAAGPARGLVRARSAREERMPRKAEIAEGRESRRREAQIARAVSAVATMPMRPARRLGMERIASSPTDAMAPIPSSARPVEPSHAASATSTAADACACPADRALRRGLAPRLARGRSLGTPALIAISLRPSHDAV